MAQTFEETKIFTDIARKYGIMYYRVYSEPRAGGHQRRCKLHSIHLPKKMKKSWFDDMSRELAIALGRRFEQLTLTKRCFGGEDISLYYKARG